jgi:hypothetical protein
MLVKARERKKKRKRERELWRVYERERMYVWGREKIGDLHSHATKGLALLTETTPPERATQLLPRHPRAQ